MALGALEMLIEFSSCTKASMGTPNSVRASKIGVPNAFHVRTKRSMYGLFENGVAKALIGGPLI